MKNFGNGKGNRITDERNKSDKRDKDKIVGLNNDDFSMKWLLPLKYMRKKATNQIIP
jgi:hypothetical protein